MIRKQLEPVVQILREQKRSVPFRDFHDYQYQELEQTWVHCLENKGHLTGADMGLGKTLMGTCMAWLARTKFPKPALILCPLPLIPDWEKELKGVFGPNVVYVLRDQKPVPMTTQVILTNYDTPYTHLKRKRRSGGKKWTLFDLEFSVIIVDEVQQMQNGVRTKSKWFKAKPSKKALAVYSLRKNAQWAVGYSGTPAAHSLTNVCSVGKFINPRKAWAKVKFWEEIDQMEFKRTEAIQNALRQFASVIGPDVLPLLVKKVETTSECPLTPLQFTLFAMIAQYGAKLVSGYRQVKTKWEQNEFKRQILALITRLRQVSVSPFLLPTFHQELLKMPLQEQKETLLGTSCKYQYVKQYIEHFHQDKHLVFCTWLPAQEHLALLLPGTLAYNGQAEAKVIDAFKNGDDHKVLLMNKAGNVGLNLQVASHVLLLNPEWNPALEDQTVARAYRQGQKKDVAAVRLITKDEQQPMIENVIRSKQLTKVNRVMKPVMPHTDESKYACLEVDDEETQLNVVCEFLENASIPALLPQIGKWKVFCQRMLDSLDDLPSKGKKRKASTKKKRKASTKKRIRS